MSALHVFWARVRSYLQNTNDEARLDEELQSHLEMLTQQYLAKGVPPDEARMQARRAMGGIEQVKEAHRDERRFAVLSALWQDLRYAARQLRNAPGFSVLTVATLAVGIGVNAAMFTVIDQTLLRRLPYPDASRLTVIEAERKMTASVAYTDVKAWQKRDHDFSEIAYYSSSAVSVDRNATSDLVYKVDSSANLFSTLGVKPFLGRAFSADEQKPGHNREAIISNGFWRKVFQGSPSVLGKALRVGGQIYTVIGVMPQGFVFPANTLEVNQIWAPYALDWSILPENSWALEAVARLKPGASARQATLNLNLIQQGLHKQDGKNHDNSKLNVASYRGALTKGIRPALTALEAAVALVWLVACANVGGLMLTRIQGRRRELSIRVALGAGRHRLVSQLLTETLLLSALAGLCGFLLSQSVTALLAHAARQHLPAGVELHASWKLLAVLLGGVFVSALLVGVLPAIHAGSRNVEEALRDNSSRAGIGRSQGRMRDGFVIAQVSLSFVLLLCAGLMLRTVYSLRHLPLGFATEHIITTSIFIPAHQYEKRDIVTALYGPLLNRLQRLPGVRDAALSSVLPVQPAFDSSASFGFVGRPKPQVGHEPQADLRIMSPNFDSLLHITLLYGRFLSETDSGETPAMAVVNQSFVRRYFKQQNPLGKQLRITEKGRFSKVTIIGVVQDVHQKTLSVEASPEIDISLRQMGPKDGLYFLSTMFMQVAVRTRGEPRSIIPETRNVLHKINPDLALNSFTTLQQNVDGSFGSQTLAGIC